jgi:hypothetical protein
MKKQTLILILSILAFSACKKESASNKNTSIVGKWYYTQDTVVQYKNGVITSRDNTGGVIFNNTSYEVFSPDGTGSQTFGSNTTPFTYSVNNNTVTTIESGDTENGAIKILSSSRLELYYDDTSADGNGNTYRVTEAAYFSK